jgi:hypothetical protein
MRTGSDELLKKLAQEKTNTKKKKQFQQIIH